MLCKKCGAELPDDAKFCEKCGEVIASEETVQLSQEEAVTEIQEAPVEAAVAETSVQETQDIIQPKQKKPVKKGWIVLLAIIAVLAIIGGVFGKQIVNGIKLAVLNPTKYYASIEYDNVKNLVDNTSKNSADLDNYSSDITLGVEATEELYDLAYSIAGQKIDLPNLNFKLKLDTSKLKELQEMKASLSLNDVEMIALDAIIDAAKEQMYAKVPLLNDDYVNADMESLGINQLSSSLTNIDNATKEELLNAIDKYAKVLLDNFGVFEKSKAELTVGDVSQKYTLLTADVTEKDVANMAIAVLQELKNDEEMTNLIQKLVLEDVAKTNGQDVKELVKEYKDALDQAIESLKNSGENKLFTYKVWVDGYGKIVAREISTEEVKIGAYSVVLGGKQANQIIFDVDGTMVEFAGTAKRSGGKLTNGEYKFKVSGSDILEIKLKEYDLNKAEKGFVALDASLSLGKAVSETLDIEEQFVDIIEKLSVTLKIDSSKDKSSIKTTINHNNKALVAVTLDGVNGKAEKISVPEKSVGVDDYEIADVNEILEDIMGKLEKAGIDQSIISGLIGASLA